MTKQDFLSRIQDREEYNEIKQLLETAQESRKKRKVKLAWVLSPGFLKGWLQFGAMDVLNLLGLDPDLVVGSSIGSYVGMAPATKTPISEIEVMQRSWSPKTARGKNYSNYGLFSSDFGITLLEKYFKQYKNLEDLPIPLITVATNLKTHKQKIFDRGPLGPAVQASIAHPIFNPVKIDGVWYQDGGIVNPAPIDVARKHGAEKIIFVDTYTEKFNTKYQPPKDLPKLVKLFLKCLPNNELPIIGWLYVAGKFPFVVNELFHESLDCYNLAEKELIKMMVLVYKPDVHLLFAEALDNEDMNIPVKLESFKHGEDLIEKGRRAVIKRFLPDLIRLRKELD